MDYRIQDNTLIISGRFEAVSSGVDGGMGFVSSLFNHTVARGFEDKVPSGYIEEVAAALNIHGPYYALLTAVDMECLSVRSEGDITAFITAGLDDLENCGTIRLGTINIILVAGARLSGGAMVNSIITATEAKTAVLHDMGYGVSGTLTDAVIAAYEVDDSRQSECIEYAGPGTLVGKQIIKLVKEGVRESILKWEGTQCLNR